MPIIAQIPLKQKMCPTGSPCLSSLSGGDGSRGRGRSYHLGHTECQGGQQMGLLMGGKLFHETLDLVQCTFCHIRLLSKDNVYCITRSPNQEVCPLCVLGDERY